MFFISTLRNDVPFFSMSRKFYYLIVLLTMATKGVIIHPILAAPEHAPKPIPRMLVGYTSGVYT